VNLAFLHLRQRAALVQRLLIGEIAEVHFSFTHLVVLLPHVVVKDFQLQLLAPVPDTELEFLVPNGLQSGKLDLAAKNWVSED